MRAGRAFGAAVLAIGTLAPCPARAQSRGAGPGAPELTVLLSGDAPTLGHVRSALARDTSLPVAIRVRAFPHEAPSEPTSTAIEESLAAARVAYINAEFAQCLSILDHAGVHELLVAGRRDVASRALFWKIACQVGAGALPEANDAAQRFAIFGFAVPSDVYAVSPEVEVLLTRVQREVAQTSAVPLRVTADVSMASVSMDGRVRTCTTPCTIDLPAGDHVVRLDADGVAPESRVVRVGEDRMLAFRTVPANPALAARQWTARYAGTASVDSTPSVRLLAQAVRARRLVLVTAERWSRSLQLQGILAVDGRIAARAERRPRNASAVLDETSALVRDLLVQAEILEPAPSLVARPVFWLAVAGAVAVAAGVTFLIVFEPPTRTRLVL